MYIIELLYTCSYNLFKYWGIPIIYKALLFSFPFSVTLLECLNFKELKFRVVIVVVFCCFLRSLKKKRYASEKYSN